MKSSAFKNNKVMECESRNKYENNIVTISGEIVSECTFDHETYGEGFYIFSLRIERLSGTSDIIQIMVSERLMDISADWRGRFVKVEGEFRSYNKRENGKTHLKLFVFAREIEETGPGDENKIYLDGYIYKTPVYRKTPFGREICDVMIAANRQCGKSDYLPCIIWGRNARFASNLEIGAHVRIEGRIQSREYQKRISETEVETRTAYEVSISTILRVEENNGNE